MKLRLIPLVSSDVIVTADNSFVHMGCFMLRL